MTYRLVAIIVLNSMNVLCAQQIVVTDAYRMACIEGLVSAVDHYYSTRLPNNELTKLEADLKLFRNDLIHQTTLQFFKEDLEKEKGSNKAINEDKKKVRLSLLAETECMNVLLRDLIYIENKGTGKAPLLVGTIEYIIRKNKKKEEKPLPTVKGTAQNQLTGTPAGVQSQTEPSLVFESDVLIPQYPLK